MDMHQKLTDTYMLVSYIKEHINTAPVEAESSHLDEIGKVTLEIASVLSEIEKKTGEDSRGMFTEYKAAVEEAATKVFGKLSEVKESLNKNTGLTKDLYTKIEDIYVEYTGLLEQGTKQLEIQRENYQKEIQELTAAVKNLSGLTDFLNNKIMTKEQLEAALKGLETQLTQIVDRDKVWNDAYTQDLSNLEATMDQVRKSYQELNTTLTSVDESFKTAVSRMDVLLMQMDILTKERGI